MNRINRIIIGLTFCIMIVSLNIVNSIEEERAEIQINQLNESISIYADSNLGILKLNNGFLHGRDENSPDLNETLINALKPEEWRLYKYNSYILAERHNANITYGLSNHYAWSEGGFPEANPWENWSYYEEYILYNMQVYDNYFPDYPVDFYDIWAEPDHSYYWHGTYEQLLELFYRTYTVVKSYNPDAKVVGPSISWFRPGFPEVKGIIDFLVDLDTIYDVRLDAISWHENGGPWADTKPEDIPYRAQYLRSEIQANFPPDYQPELHVNEYLGGIVHLSPGWNVGFLRYLEEANIDKAMRACWYTYSLDPEDYCSDCWYGLNGMFMSDGQTPQRAYWIQYTHSQMEGQIKLDVSESNENTNVIATKHDSSNQINLLVGRYFKNSPNDVSIHIVNYPYNQENVFVKIEYVPNDPTFYDNPPQMIAMPDGPILLSNESIPVVNNEIILQINDFEDGDAYIITINPSNHPPNIPPVANFTWDPLYPTTEDMINFTDLSTDSDGFIVNWSWDFGDGNISYEQNPTHQYNIVGNYTVCLTIEDDIGAGDSICKMVIVTVFQDTDPPEVTNIHDFPDPQAIDGYVNITCDVTDFTGVSSVYVDITDGPIGFTPVNVSMTKGPGDSYYNYTNYSLEGNYTYHIWANDTLGNSITTSDYKFRIISGDVVVVEIPMEIGWNLITLPVDNDMTMASSLAENITGAISVNKWDATTQTYKPYIVGGPPSFDFQIDPGMGLFVDVDTTSTLFLSGSPAFGVSIDLEIGWNMIGWYHQTSSMASSLAENITGSISVNKWDSVTQTYKPYIVGGPPSFDFEITPGMGLFVDVDEESTWHGEG